MKRLLILLFIQWNAFGSDCGFSSDQKDPELILEQITAINLMDEKKAVLCFNELKSFLIETEPHTNAVNNNQQNIDISTAYENSRKENLERIQYLLSLTTENQENTQKITPHLHAEISGKNMFPIKITLTQINQTQFIAGKPIFSNQTPSDLDKQVEKLQPQQQTSMLWNPYLRLPWMLPTREPFLGQMTQAPAPNEQTTEAFPPNGEKEQTLQWPNEHKHVWTENIHIEFPAIILCRKPADELSQAFFTAFKNDEKELINFTNNHTEIRQIYINIMEWLDSIRNQEGQNLPHTHPLFNFAVYHVQWNQIPDFILESITAEQKEKLTHLINLSKRYSWTYNLHFEYRKCLPKVFRENLLISYSAPAPLQTETSFGSSPQNEKLFDIDLLYEFSVHTPPFASFLKKSYPIKIFRQSSTDWDDFTVNDMRNRYEPEWRKTLQFLRQFILQNRTYLDVSF